jgi:hypothetical protein
LQESWTSWVWPVCVCVCAKPTKKPFLISLNFQLHSFPNNHLKHQNKLCASPLFVCFYSCWRTQKTFLLGEKKKNIQLLLSCGKPKPLSQRISIKRG